MDSVKVNEGKALENEVPCLVSEKRDRRVVEETRDGRKIKDGVPPAAPSPTLFSRVCECAIRVKHGFSYLPLLFIYI